MIFDLELIIFGIVCGIILLQAPVIAPNVFKHLDQNQTQDLFRAIFPKFSLYILLLVSLSLAVGILDNVKFDIQAIIALLTVVLTILYFAIIPFTNETRDKNHQKRFKSLHNLNVISTLIIFLTNLSLVFFNI